MKTNKLENKYTKKNKIIGERTDFKTKQYNETCFPKPLSTKKIKIKKEQKETALLNKVMLYLLGKIISTSIHL